jgi:peptidoglycan/LPS O-acetylase OafA/YrhL
MTNSSNIRFEFPDFARGYAILTIVAFHVGQRMSLSPILSQAIALGGTGVHLFFFLSGFGLSQSSLAAQPLVFYRRRLSKIWLPFVVALTISWASLLFPDGLKSWLAGVFLYQMFSSAWMESFGGHFWFISTIIQFYIVFPMLWWLSRRYSAIQFALGCLLVSIGWWCLVYVLGKQSERSWNSCMFQFLWEFGAGMVLIPLLKLPLLQRIQQWWHSNAWWKWGVIGILSVGVMVVMILKLGAIGKVFNDIPAFVGYSGLCVAIFWWSSKYTMSVRQFFEWVGRFSFTLYLFHILVLELMIRWIIPVGDPLPAFWVLPYMVVAIFIGWWLEPYIKRLTTLF